MFLNPYLLFGISAVAAPIVIHLLNKQKIQRVRWAAMRFLYEAVEQNQRKLNIEDLLLLLLRCLILTLLAIALARPALKAAGVFGDSGPVKSAFVIDNSYSMTQTDGTQSRFEQSKSLADQTLTSLPAGSSAAIFLGSNIVEPIIPEPTFDLNTARSTIDKLTVSGRGSDLLPAIQTAIETLKKQGGSRKQLYVLTDGQANAFSQGSEIVKLLDANKDDIHATIGIVGEMEQRNLGVSDLRKASALAIVDLPLRFTVSVTNYGHTEARQVVVKLAIDGAPASEEALIDEIDAGQTKPVSLFGRLHSEGFHTITANLPADRLPADDSRSIVVRAIKQVQCLVVDGNPGREERENESFYLEQALQPVDPVYRDQFFIQVKAISDAELESARLDQYDAVFLANVRDFSNRSLSNFKTYLRQGGGIIIFPGSLTQPLSYNDDMAKRRGFLPAMLGEPVGDPTNLSTYKTFQASHYEHPIVNIWNDPGSGQLSSARFYRTFPLLPAPTTLAPEGGAPADPVKPGEPEPPRVVLNYSDGTPAVMERKWSLGRVILFSSSISTAWNDLAVRPSFIPLIHRVLGSVLERQDDLLNIRVGDRFVYYPDQELIGQQVTITAPAVDAKTAPKTEQRPIELVDDRALLHYDHTDLAGIYTGTSGTDFNIKFAALPDPSESSLESISPAMLEQLKANATIINWKPGSALESKEVTLRAGAEFWLPLVWTCLILAAVESFLAQRFSRSR